MERARLNAFIERLGCAERSGGYVFLRDPSWSERECEAAAALMQVAAELSHPEVGWLCIRTGGSSGGLKFARHDEVTLGAAIDGFCRHFELERVSALGVLPPWHVSGLMARLRCHATGGAYLDCPWKRLEAGDLPALTGRDPWVLSLVPTQLQRLLANPGTVSWLRQFHVILIGGGPMWRELADAAAAAELPVALSYGMTETAAMVAAQRPAEFRAGDRSSGTAMPHATLRISEGGVVAVAGASVHRGYFGKAVADAAGGSREFVTSDLGHIDVAGKLHVLGRTDDVIITGGKKVVRSEVEAALRASGEFADVAVIGVPDVEWGTVVVACYAAADKAPDCALAASALSAYQRPKHFVPMSPWPRNAQGKIDRCALAERACALLAR